MWFVVKTNPKCEAKARIGIERQGLSVFQPMAERFRRRRYTTSRQRVLVPILVGYILVDLGLEPHRHFGAVGECDGVKTILGKHRDGKRIVGVPDREVAALLDLVRGGVFDEKRALALWRQQKRLKSKKPLPVFDPNQAVRVTAGPLAGITFRFDRQGASGSARLIGQIFGSLVPVEVPADMVETA